MTECDQSMIKSSSLSVSLPSTGLSILVLVSNWKLSEDYQAQLVAMAKVRMVEEVIMVGSQVEDFPALLRQESKIRPFQLHSGPLPLMAEAGAFEARGDILVILKQEAILAEKTLQEISEAISEGYEFGGFLRKNHSWYTAFLKMATVKCKGLFWFHITHGYYMSQKVYQLSGGFKQNGKLSSFFDLLCRQQQISPYKFILF